MFTHSGLVKWIMLHSYNEILHRTKKEGSRWICTDRESDPSHIKIEHPIAAWNVQYNFLCVYTSTQICWEEYGKMLKEYTINWNECD